MSLFFIYLSKNAEKKPKNTGFHKNIKQQKSSPLLIRKKCFLSSKSEY